MTREIKDLINRKFSATCAGNAELVAQLGAEIDAIIRAKNEARK